MHSADVVIAGAGIIGLSVAIELRRAGASVTVLDRGEPGREASSAAAGMLVTADPDTPSPLKWLANASAAMYPAFVEELELRSHVKVNLENRGALYVADERECLDVLPLSDTRISELEPDLARYERVYLLEEQSVDPELLVRAALVAAKQTGTIVHHESQIESVNVTKEHLLEVRSARGSYTTATFVNCTGAWAAEIEGCSVPARPRKGQMFSVVPRRQLHHTIRSHHVYLLPRKDGRVIIGATVEDNGFDKTVDPSIIQQLHQAAANLVPSIGEAKILDAWAGLRPGSPDDLPIIGPCSIPGTYAATGHFRNGILLAPITAALIADLIQGKQPRHDLRPFAASRFAPSQAFAG